MKIEVHNESTVLTDATVELYTAACAEQLALDVAPAWEMFAPVVSWRPKTKPADPTAYQMGIFDDADQPGALGYHDTDETGKPRGFVFAKTTIADGEKVSVTLSHELAEMFKDPSCTLWTQTADGNMRALELCDAVEADEYTVNVGDEVVDVSNFLYPAYFSSGGMGKTDHLDKLNGAPAPARTPGGYDIVVSTSGQPSQEFSRQFSELSAGKARRKSHSTSRTAKRVARRAP